jgi:CDP-glycerol glycerophosphotransferase (TagB/SpsB family)
MDDVFSNDELKSRLVGKKIVLYMPTFRENNDVLLEQIEKLYQSEEFKRVLIKNNAVFLGKLHYLCRGNIRSNECAILLNDEDVIDTQKLLKLADILITDYSSCAVDYALLKRPVLFYFPQDGYDVKKWMMDDTMDFCSVCKVETGQECIKKIGELLEDGRQGVEQCDVLNGIFNQIVDIGSYAERTYNGICDLLKE